MISDDRSLINETFAQAITLDNANRVLALSVDKTFVVVFQSSQNHEENFEQQKISLIFSSWNGVFRYFQPCK